MRGAEAESDERFKSIERASEVPPIVVLLGLDGSIHVLDGWHRTEVARRQGAMTIQAVVAHGDPDSEGA